MGQFITCNEHAICLSSGIMVAGLAAGSEIFQFRWTDASHVALIREIKISAACDTVAFTAGSAIFDVIKSTAWTVDGTGGTVPTLTGNSTKLVTSDAATLLTSIRIASTAALTAGTKTLDPTALFGVISGVEAGAGKQFLPPTVIYSIDADSEEPASLLTNEGFSIRATVPATGTWKFALSIKWLEQK